MVGKGISRKTIIVSFKNNILISTLKKTKFNNSYVLNHEYKISQIYGIYLNGLKLWYSQFSQIQGLFCSTLLYLSDVYSEISNCLMELCETPAKSYNTDNHEISLVIRRRCFKNFWCMPRIKFVFIRTTIIKTEIYINWNTINSNDFNSFP